MRKIAFSNWLAILLVFVTSCTPVEVGFDKSGISLRAEGDKIIEAVKSFARDHGAQPSGIGALSPKYLPIAPGPEFSLEGVGANLSVVVKYKSDRPRLGRVICSRRISETQWECVGHY